MRSFIQFLIRNYAIIIFILLEAVSFYFVFTYNKFQHTYFVNTAGEMSGNVLDRYHNFKSYFSLDEVNDSLINENARLRAQLRESMMIDTTGVYSIKDSAGKQLYTYIPAEVISNSYTEPNNYITLNRGSNHGIQKNMGVISSNGIAGQVVEVSPNFSVVMSVLHSRFKASVAIKRNNTQGRLLWDMKDPSHIRMVEVSEQGFPAIGDTIFTTRSSMIYPPGIIVGTISDFGKEAGNNYYTLDIKLSTDFSALQYVYVVNDLMRTERDTLQTKVLNADR